MIYQNFSIFYLKFQKTQVKIKDYDENFKMKLKINERTIITFKMLDDCLRVENISN